MGTERVARNRLPDPDDPTIPKRQRPKGCTPSKTKLNSQPGFAYLSDYLVKETSSSRATDGLRGRTRLRKDLHDYSLHTIVSGKIWDIDFRGDEQARTDIIEALSIISVGFDLELRDYLRKALKKGGVLSGEEWLYENQPLCVDENYSYVTGSPQEGYVLHVEIHPDKTCAGAAKVKRRRARGR